MIAEVIESQSALVRPGMSAEVRLPGFPGRSWSGTVDYLYPDLRPENRTLRVRVRLANPDRSLKPNMFASVRLVAAQRESALTVPAEAVIRTGRGDRVVLALAEGRFKPVSISVGLTIGGRAEVLEGLREGDRVVTSAQFLLDSESSLTAGLDRLEAPADEAAAPGPVWTDATVDGPISRDRMVTLSHPPIPAIGWPAMTMEFVVDPAVTPSALPSGARVRVALLKSEDGSYRVVAVEPAGKP